MESVRIGSIVHYVPFAHETSHGQPEHKAALIVSLFGTDGMANLTVFMDWINDGTQYYNNRSPMLWATSRNYSEEYLPGTWHWPEKT